MPRRGGCGTLEAAMRRLAAPLVLPLRHEDLDEVVALSAASFTEPWARAAFEEELARDWSVVRVARAGPRAELAGFVACWLVRDELHVLSLAVAPALRRRGYGRALLEGAVSVARSRGARYATLEVRKSNVAARRLYAGLGFSVIGERPGYYVAPDEDALVLLRELPPRAAPPGRATGG
jgi:ribosomal-protein-alanine N-acetyltransferase